MTIIDLVFLVIIVGCAIICFIRGFLEELFGKGIPIVSIICAVLFYRKIDALLISSVKNQIFSIILSLLIIFVVVFLVLKIIQLAIQKIFSGFIFKSLDRVLGLVFGLVEGVAIVCAILIVMNAQPWFDCSSVLEGSFFLKYLGSFVQAPAEVLRDTISS